MDDIPRIILCTLIREQGVQVIQNASKFQNLLIDYTKGEFKKERKCLNDSLAEGIPETLLTKKDQLSYHQLSQQLSQKLIDNLGVTPELAKWTVDSWALALGVISEKKLHPQDYFTTITSTPSGAGVYLDGFMKGITPLTLKNLEMGNYQIQLKREGYETWTNSLEIVSRNNQDISVSLIESPPESASINIETYPSNAEIFLNSKKYGRTNKTILNLSGGYFELRLVLPGYRDIIKHLQIREGDNLQIWESFIREPEKQPIYKNSGKITVKTHPSYAAVYLDNTFIGNTPLESYEIPSGYHSVSVRLSAYTEYKEKIHVGPGEERFIHETLVKQPSSLGKKVVYAICVIGFLLLIMSFVKTPIPTPTTDPIPTITTPSPTITIAHTEPNVATTSVITLTVTQVPAQPPVSSYISHTEGAPYINPQTLERRIHDLINKRRQENGLSSLTFDPFLANIARSHSWDMVTRNFFDNKNPDGQGPKERGDAAGYPCVKVMDPFIYSGIAENLYQGNRASSYYTNSAGEIVSYDWRTLDEIAEAAVNGWMNSPDANQQNLLSSYFTYEGIGVAFAPDDKVYITQNFC